MSSKVAGKEPGTTPSGDEEIELREQQAELQEQQAELANLSYKRGEFVTCPACRHGATTVTAKERLSSWRYVAITGVIIVFTPLTMGIMLCLIPLVYRPQFTIHSCRRCGMRLAIATGGAGEYQWTIPAAVETENYAAAEDDWRPDLARLPGGMRVARSPLGPCPEIEQKELKLSHKRFRHTKARTRLRLVADDWLNGTVRCVLDTGLGQPGARKLAGKEEDVLYTIHLRGLDDLDRYDGSVPEVRVLMRGPPPEVSLPSDKKPPAYTEDDGIPGFTDCCLVRLFRGKDYSIHLHLPPKGTTTADINNYYSSSSSSSSSAAAAAAAATSSAPKPTVNVSNIPVRLRTQFAGVALWRWKSSEGYLLWADRKLRDADMTAEMTTLCLVDEYERLVAAVDGWDTTREADGAGGSRATHSLRLKLYAELEAGVLGEILGSYCALRAQRLRVGKELAAEKRQRESNSN